MPGSIAGKLRRTAVRLLATIGLLFLIVTFTPFVSWYSTLLSGPWGSTDGDILVVLSASGPNVGIMDPSTYWRCFMALLYYRERPYRQIVVTGKDSATGMRDFFVFNGVPADRILVENQASNTHENAVYTTRLLAGVKGRIVLLTSESHIFRARKCFAKEGLAVTPTYVRDVTKRTNDISARPSLFMSEIQETAAIVYYWYRGWI